MDFQGSSVIVIHKLAAPGHSRICWDITRMAINLPGWQKNKKQIIKYETFSTSDIEFEFKSAQMIDVVTNGIARTKRNFVILCDFVIFVCIQM